jgi:hypothetical protein
VRLSKDSCANRIRARLIDKVTLIGAVCRNDNTARTREAATGLIRSILQSDTSYVKAVAFSPDGLSTAKEKCLATLAKPSLHTSLIRARIAVQLLQAEQHRGDDHV